MRFKQFLNEDPDEDIDNIVNTIKKDCKPFITDWKKLKSDSFLYSGRKDFVIGLGKRQVREDRKPRDTPPFIHKVADDWFFKKFGVRSRSNAVFTTFDYYSADYYGKPFYVFPIGKYTAVSSPVIEDLFNAIQYKYNYLFDDEYKKILSEAIYTSSLTKEEIQKKIEALLNSGNYSKKLTVHKNEVMITCKNYYILSPGQVPKEQLYALLK